MPTTPGHASRTTSQTFRQFPQRDGAVMEAVEHATDFAEQPEIGHSNSDAVKEAPEDVTPEIPEPEELKPGFTNAKSVGGDVAEPAVKKTAPAKKTAVRKR